MNSQSTRVFPSEADVQIEEEDVAYWDENRMNLATPRSVDFEFRSKPGQMPEMKGKLNVL